MKLIFYEHWLNTIVFVWFSVSIWATQLLHDFVFFLHVFLLLLLLFLYFLFFSPRFILFNNLICYFLCMFLFYMIIILVFYVPVKLAQYYVFLLNIVDLPACVLTYLLLYLKKIMMYFSFCFVLYKKCMILRVRVQSLPKFIL